MLLVAEGFEERDAGAGEEAEDFGFSEGIVRFYVSGFDDDFEGVGFGAVD